MTASLSALSGAAAGQVSLCCLPQVNALLTDVPQVLRGVQVGFCENRECKAVGTMQNDMMEYDYVLW